ncbi:MAG: PQQ-like beta-propeller repeat protein [Euryarchaeota archaeon]|nr:PQQ-like beta-propeller repeat protein [Euryarchaeota archaeon]
MRETGNAICASAALALLLFAAALPMAIVAASDDGRGAWPSWHGDRKNTGLSPFDTSGVDGTLRWKVPLPGKAGVSPVIGSNGSVYVSTVGYWSPDNVNAPPIFSPGLYALRPDGSVEWNLTYCGPYGLFAPSGMVVGTGAGTIYYIPYYQNVLAVGSDGVVAWNMTMPAILSHPAVTANGTILVGCAEGFHAISPNGSPLWNFTTRSPVYSSPAVDDDGTIYFVDNNYRLYALGPDGRPKWFASIKEFDWDRQFSCLSSPAVGADGTVYVGSPDGNLYAVNKQGSQKWKLRTGKAIYSSPAIGPGGTIYVCSSDDRLYAITPDGVLKWSCAAGNNIESSPAVGADGTVYVGTTSRHGWTSSEMMALSPDGSVKWRCNISGSVSSSPAIGDDGTVYVASSRMLYAFGSTPLSHRMNMIYGVLATALAFAAAAYCARRLIPWQSPKK